MIPPRPDVDDRQYDNVAYGPPRLALDLIEHERAVAKRAVEALQACNEALLSLYTYGRMQGDTLETIQRGQAALREIERSGWRE
jgi:hypothetical protein